MSHNVLDWRNPDPADFPKGISANLVLFASAGKCFKMSAVRCVPIYLLMAPIPGCLRAAVLCKVGCSMKGSFVSTIDIKGQRDDT